MGHIWIRPLNQLTNNVKVFSRIPKLKVSINKEVSRALRKNQRYTWNVSEIYLSQITFLALVKRQEHYLCV